MRLVHMHASRRPAAGPIPALAVLTITQAEIDRAVPSPPGVRPLLVASKGGTVRSDRPPGKARLSGLAIASFVCALAGIPLFGIITGLVAIVLAAIALGAIRTTQERGLGLALSGLLLGIADVIGWMIFLTVMLSRPGSSTGSPRCRPTCRSSMSSIPRCSVP